MNVHINIVQNEKSSDIAIDNNTIDKYKLYCRNCIQMLLDSFSLCLSHLSELE